VSGVHPARTHQRRVQVGPQAAHQWRGREPLREIAIASTLPEMLRGVGAVGSDLRFFSSVGTPSILIGEMTLAGV
jgi:hypothetical protein